MSEAGFVGLLGKFRRRPVKRSPPGFERSRADITALGNSIGEMLTSPVREAPPIARDAPLLQVEPARAERAKPPEKPKPRKTTGAAAPPRAAPRAGYLAVHSVEKSFGSRQVVRGVGIS